MVAPLESAVVRIRKSNGAIVGAGFLVHEKYVLTCAHVIAQALGISESTPQCPSESVHLDFPLIDPAVQLTAQVVLWRPAPAKSASTQSHEDIAALELNSSPPPSAKPVRLLLEDDLWDHPFQAFGFPAGHDDGLWCTGVLRAKQGTGWVQAEDIKSPGGRLESGYSGTPIWDEKLNGVVGMAVAADLKRTEAKIAFIIPTRLIATTWTALAELTIPPLILVSKKPNRSLQWILASLFGLAALGSSTLLIPQVRDRLGLGEAACFRAAERKGEKAIAFAKFSNESRNVLPTNPQLERNIYDRLDALSLLNVRVCSISRSILQRNEAQKTGERLNAAVVVWGRRDGTTLDVGVTSVKVKTAELNKLPSPTDRSIDFETQTKDWADLVPIMIAFKLSRLYSTEGHLQYAIDVLHTVLLYTETRELDWKNSITKEVISIAYYELGELYAPDKLHCKNIENCENAIKAYQKAFERDKTYYWALLNQGLLYTALGQFDEAEQAYTQVINTKPEDKETVEVALNNRANVYLKLGKMQRAIKDFRQILISDPKDISVLRLMGLTQLQIADIEGAKQTYIHIKKYLGNQNTQQEQIFSDLKMVSRDKPSLLPITQELASIFK